MCNWSFLNKLYGSTSVKHVVQTCNIASRQRTADYGSSRVKDDLLGQVFCNCRIPGPLFGILKCCFRSPAVAIIYIINCV